MLTWGSCRHPSVVPKPWHTLLSEQEHIFVRDNVLQSVTGTIEKAVIHRRNRQANFEVVSKWPASQHFKECVMCKVMANIFKVIVLSSNPNTFLAVGYSPVVWHWASVPNIIKKNRLKLEKMLFLNMILYWKPIQNKYLLVWFLFCFQHWSLKLSNF